MPLFARESDPMQTSPAVRPPDAVAAADPAEVDLLREAVQSADNAIALFQTLSDSDGRPVNFQCLLANPLAVTYLGQPLDVLLSGPLLNDHPTEPQQRLVAQMRAVAQSGQPSRFKQYAERPGQWFDVALVPRPGGLRLISTDITLLKGQQQKLDNQAGFYQAILNNVPAGIRTLRPYRNSRGEIDDFIYVFINDATLASRSRPAKRFLGSRLLQLSPGLRQDGTFERLVTVMQTGQPQQFALTEERDGRAEPGELWAAAHGDYLICSFTPTPHPAPVRPRQNDESNRLQRVIDHAPAGLMLLEAVRDPASRIIVDFRYVLTNERNAYLTGHTVAAMTGQLVSSLFPGYQSLPLFETLVRVTESGEAVQDTFRYDRYGVNAWFEGHYVRQDDGVLFAFLDVTALKDAELAQQRQTDQLQAILDNSQTAISLHEAIRDSAGAIVDFRTVRANQLAVTLWGPLADAILNQPFTQVPNPTRATDLARYTRVVETGQAETIEYAYGDRAYLMATAKSGDGVVVSFIEMTELRQSRQQLEAANRDLARSNESLQQFAFIASHDLQEPLRKITAFGDLLIGQYGDRLETDGLDLVQRMQSAAGRMSALVRDLLNYSRLTRRADPFRPVDLNAVLTGVLNDLDLRIRDTGAQLRMDALPTLPGDPTQLGQLFQNLLTNAMKCQPAGQTPVVTVRCERVLATKTMPPGLTTERGYAKISVTDNGIGFDNQYAERIFNVFERLHGKNAFAGTGIGLAVCRRVAESHGGSIQAHSQPGVGTTFTVYLPTP